MNGNRDTMVDARGIRVPATAYARIASLVPSLTETVFRLGAGGKLVSRTIYCVEPRSRVNGVPACGGTKNPDIDAILELRPDLALACVEENKPEHLARLAHAGVAVFAVMPRALDDVAGLLRDFGVLLDARPAAGRELADLTAARLAAGEWRARRGAPRRAACLVWQKPWMAAGGGNHITAMMNEVGLTNVLAGREGYFEIDPAELGELQPEVLLLPDEPYRFTPHCVRALVAAGAIASPARALLLDGKLLTWYGARTAGALRGLVRLLSEGSGMG